MFTHEQDSGNGGNFLKLDSGQSVTGVFRGDVHKFYQSWPKGGDKRVSTEPFEGAKARFKANIVIHEDGKFVARIFEFGVLLNNQLAAIADDCEDITKAKIKISRQGSDKSTKWTITQVTKGPLTEKQLKEIDAVELNVLGDQPAVEASADSDSIPF